MPNYVVNINGSHDVHDENAACKNLPNPENRRNLGWFSNPQNAIAEAQKTFGSAYGCKQCAK